ncbi:MAG: glycosyltransferase family 2 protein [Chloroflexi bacterium]|nr:glycosyltransferase family 2 protein [Chloroflexota bacterium]MDL1942891.1 glycosyltransferase [Chloroflexi bacterium CFX2]
MRISVIIPVRNGGKDFRDCLAALSKSARPPDELIVVDDASTDDSARTACDFGARVITQGAVPVGPAKSRNCGAGVTRGDILVFIDADVRVHEDTLAAFEAYFERQPGISALFGSYDDNPPHRNAVSLYKNLQHHFVHQHGKRDASTFWAGAGAIRRDVFEKLGGFNGDYSQPSIEDIELGLRLKNSGCVIWLCPEIQVTHLKRWSFSSLLKSDILNRAVPWTRLILSSSQLPSNLNLDLKSRVSALCVWAALLGIGLGFRLPAAWLAALPVLAFFIALNFELYRFFHRRGGSLFVLAGIALHALYYCYSSFVFGALWVGHLISRRGRDARLIPAPVKLVEESRHDR